MSMQADASNASLQCKQCGKQFTTIQALGGHVRKHVKKQESKSTSMQADASNASKDKQLLQEWSSSNITSTPITPSFNPSLTTSYNTDFSNLIMKQHMEAVAKAYGLQLPSNNHNNNQNQQSNLNANQLLPILLPLLQEFIHGKKTDPVTEAFVQGFQQYTKAFANTLGKVAANIGAKAFTRQLNKVFIEEEYDEKEKRSTKRTKRDRNIETDNSQNLGYNSEAETSISTNTQTNVPNSNRTETKSAEQRGSTTVFTANSQGSGRSEEVSAINEQEKVKEEHNV